MLIFFERIFKLLVGRSRAFGSCKTAVAMLEFAIVLPMLLVMLFGSAEVLRYMSISKRAEQAAKDIGQMISASEATISGTRLWNIYQTIPLLIPDVTTDATVGGRDWYLQALMNVTFIKMEKTNAACVSDCAVKARVAWAYGKYRRACGELDPTKASGKFLKDALPQSFFDNPTNLISFEVQYIYQPIISHLFKKFVRINRAFYIQPRNVDYIGVTKLGASPYRFGQDCRGV